MSKKPYCVILLILDKLTKSNMRSRFLNLGTRLVFNTLKQGCIKALIWQYFILVYNINIKTNISAYNSSKIICYLMSSY